MWKTVSAEPKVLKAAIDHYQLDQANYSGCSKQVIFPRLHMEAHWFLTWLPLLRWQMYMYRGSLKRFCLDNINILTY